MRDRDSGIQLTLSPSADEAKAGRAIPDEIHSVADALWTLVVIACASFVVLASGVVVLAVK